MTLPRTSRDAGWIEVYADYADRAVLAACPGRRWNPLRRCWALPDTPASMVRLLAIWPRLEVECPDCLAIRLNQVHARAELNRMKPQWQKTAPRHLAETYAWEMRPWDHQIGATLYAARMDACLLHCWMGTGKTKITLDALRIRRQGYGRPMRAMVVCPVSVLDVWEQEVGKHAPGQWNVLRLDGKLSVARRAERLSAALDALPRAGAVGLLVLVNYEAVWRMPMSEVVLGTEWDAVVCDESHRLKAPSSSVSKFFARLRPHVAWRLCLSGTPLPHSPLDAYGQYRFLDPAIFGTRFTAFRDCYAVMGGYGQHQVVAWRNQGELRACMDEVRYHVPEDVLDLPPLQVLDRHCELGSAAQAIYDEMEENFVAEVRGGQVTAANALVKLLRLHQITGGWLPVDGGEPEEISTAKRELLRDMLEDLHGEPVVVFTLFTQEMAAVRELATKLGFRVGEISGRQKDYSAWQAGEIDCLVVQPRAGGLGIDLSRARVAIYYSLGYSLGDYQQAIARLHRPGQVHPVVVYRLLATDTVDGHIVRALDARHVVVESILGEIGGRSDVIRYES